MTDEVVTEESQAKRAKTGQLKWLAGLKVESILREDAMMRLLALQATFEDGSDTEKAVIVLNQKTFDKEKVQQMLGGAAAQVGFHNDIYAKYALTVQPEFCQVSCDITYPATERDIAKWKTQEFHMVHETPAVYAAVTLPHIESIPASRIAWVYNILEKKKEVERLIFEDEDPTTGFMLHPDQKWDQRQVSELYCLAIVHRRDVRSLRDLRAEHLPLLRNVKDKGCQALHDKYGVAKDQLRVYVHYQPSYYHLHVHFVHMAFQGAPGMQAGKAVLLDDVIDNISTYCSDFYEKKTLSYALGEFDPLWAKMQGHKQQQQ